MNRLTDNDKNFGPFTLAKWSKTFSAYINSGDDENRETYLMLVAFGWALRMRVWNWLCRPWRARWVECNWDSETVKRLGRSGYWEIHERRFGFSLSDMGNGYDFFQCFLPRNPIVDLIHKSGECLCGAFAEEGELEELKLWPETRAAYDEIKALQLEVLAAGFPWGWEDAPPRWFQEKKHGQGFMFNYDQHLCWSCNKNFARGQTVTTRNDQPGMPTRADGDGVYPDATIAL